MINTEPSEGMLTPNPEIEISLRNAHKFTYRDLNMAAPHKFVYKLSKACNVWSLNLEVDVRVHQPL